MKNEKEIKQFLIGLGAFIFYFLTSKLISLPLDLFGINYKEWGAEALMTYNIVYELVILCILIFIYFKELKEQFNDYKGHIKEYLKKNIKYWFIALGLMCVSNLIINSIVSGIAKNEEQVRTLLGFFPIHTFILSVLFAPIMEELIFRLSIHKICFKIKWLFIPVSGLVFGLLHVVGSATTWTDWLYIVPYSIPGIMFAYSYVKSSNIFVPISLHMIHNGILVTLQILLMI